MKKSHAVTITSWTFALFKGTVAWLVTNFLYVALSTNFFVIKNLAEIKTLVVTFIFLIPFIFAPGMVATFSCVRHFFNEDKQYSLWKVLKKSYFSNYGMSFKLGCLYVLLLVSLYASYIYYGKWGVIGRIIPIILFGIITIIFLFILAYVSDRFETLIGYIKKSIVIMINHPVLIIFMTLEFLSLIYFCHFNSALLLLIAPGGSALIFMYFYQQCTEIELKKLNR